MPMPDVFHLSQTQVTVGDCHERQNLSRDQIVFRHFYEVVVQRVAVALG